MRPFSTGSSATLLVALIVLSLPTVLAPTPARAQGAASAEAVDPVYEAADALDQARAEPEAGPQASSAQGISQAPTEIATARHMAMSKVVARLFSNAMQTTDIRGSNAACMFILKTQFGWRESNRPDQPDSWEGTLATKETREKLDAGRIEELSTTELANLYREADKFTSGTRH